MNMSIITFILLMFFSCKEDVKRHKLITNNFIKEINSIKDMDVPYYSVYSSSIDSFFLSKESFKIVNESNDLFLKCEYISKEYKCSAYWEEGSKMSEFTINRTGLISSYKDFFNNGVVRTINNSAAKDTCTVINTNVVVNPIINTEQIDTTSKPSVLWNGNWEFFWNNGNKRKFFIMDRCKMNGLMEMWDDNGVKAFQGNFIDDNKIGKHVYWNKEGLIGLVEYYDKGKLIKYELTDSTFYSLQHYLFSSNKEIDLPSKRDTMFMDSLIAVPEPLEGDF